MISRYKFLIIWFVPFIFLSALYPQKLPVGYIEQYSENCSNKNFFKTFYPESVSNWKFIPAGKNQILSIFADDSSANKAFPGVRGIVRYMIFGEFIVEFEFKTESNPSGLKGFCFLGPVKNSSTYYTFLFTTDSVSFSFIKKGKIITTESQYISNLNDGWNKVRIERDILMRSATIILNGNFDHKLVFTDKSLVMGFIGFGTNESSSSLRNIHLWAPTSIIDSTFTWHRANE